MANNNDIVDEKIIHKQVFPGGLVLRVVQIQRENAHAPEIQLYVTSDDPDSKEAFRIMLNRCTPCNAVPLEALPSCIVRQLPTIKTALNIALPPSETLSEQVENIKRTWRSFAHITTAPAEGIAGVASALAACASSTTLQNIVNVIGQHKPATKLCYTQSTPLWYGYDIAMTHTDGSDLPAIAIYITNVAAHPERITNAQRHLDANHIPYTLVSRDELPQQDVSEVSPKVLKIAVPRYAERATQLDALGFMLEKLNRAIEDAATPIDAQAAMAAVERAYPKHVETARQSAISPAAVKVSGLGIFPSY